MHIAEDFKAEFPCPILLEGVLESCWLCVDESFKWPCSASYGFSRSLPVLKFDVNLTFCHMIIASASSQCWCCQLRLGNAYLTLNHHPKLAAVGADINFWPLLGAPALPCGRTTVFQSSSRHPSYFILPAKTNTAGRLGVTLSNNMYIVLRPSLPSWA